MTAAANPRGKKMQQKGISSGLALKLGIGVATVLLAIGGWVARVDSRVGSTEQELQERGPKVESIPVIHNDLKHIRQEQLEAKDERKEQGKKLDRILEKLNK